METYQIELSNDLSQLDTATKFVTHLLEKNLHNPEKEKNIDDIELVISEACTNAFKYSDKTKNETIKLEINLNQTSIEVKLQSPGENKYIESIQNPSIAHNESGGNGNFIMKALTDEIQGQNIDQSFILTFKKKF
ncbi:MAG: ATP-binding protein [Spirochaetota bacterium]